MARAEILEYTVKVDLVTETCCVCGAVFAMTREFKEKMRENGGWFYCPAGHSQYYTDTAQQRLERLRGEIADLQRQNGRLREQRGRLENDLLDEVKTRKALERRVNAGVCPHCHRTFKQLARHMQCKHPEVA